ncbi:probable LRR receptor-like serine/threonine-protein kinase At1g05700 isoform X2 [Cajanus cajan]|uniref:probable LRR receptor-like serine/threonine-protein kinase At1g05700 isoform X2 n=1 Tax=Cajanus cajan TaxID=3821 RepID=UPI00098DC333|nr:probable LRR receptor-like serine/threonine-protein kinase At1g05700 isoform X2 [Cajanus cajan]
MERKLQWILVLAVCASSLIHIVAENNEGAHRNLANIDYSGVISIDCGVNEGYTDKTTNLQYEADDIQFGEIYNISSIYNFNYVTQIQKQLNTLRSFPNGKRNCYTMTPKQGKNKKYIIRAYFAYGNYDNKNKPPIFDLYIGVNIFKTINFTEVDKVIRIEAIHFASIDTIDFCLVNIDQGVPFISLLELWPLDNSIYQTSSTLLTLDLLTRINLGASEDNNSFIRYTDDIYGRSWEVQNNYYNVSINTSSAIDVDKLIDPYKLPTEVLSTGVEMLKSGSLEFTLNYGTNSEYYVYLHFFDFEDRASKQKRILNIIINGFDDAVSVTQSLTLPYWKPKSIILPIKQGKGIFKILIEATSDSDLPAMLNALEIYRVIPQSDSATQQEDVDAIWHIKDFYKISKMNWQGDPCEPNSFTWEGVICSNGDTPRIISLNLSSSKLLGGIDVSFSNLTYLETLDLSNNELTGEVPELFAKLPQLKILNLSRNMLTGSIPESLKAKSSNKSLQLSLDGNLCSYQAGSCKSNKHKFIIPLVASITTFVAVVIIIAIIVVVIRRLRKNVISSISVKDESLKSTNQVFSYSEILRITNNFTTMIGKGGFGKVYLGTLECGKIVAVKTLSLPSTQGYKEFQSEAKLLMHVHHRNVVSLVGYCDEGETKALVYEYLSEGNLQQKLSDKNPNFLEWIQRLKIAMDAANGLDYLHNGCQPPVIHRDLKTSNILLDENMHAKISDFGVSKTFANDTDTYVTTYPAGTPGYVDPEFYCSGTLNRKSDVYSFGIILLELITGQPALRGTPDNLSYILPCVNNKLRTGNIQEIVDPRLKGNYNAASAWKFIGIAMSCLPQVPIHRPDIGHVASELKECLSLELSLERTVSNVRDSLVMNSRQIEFLN